MHAPREKLRPVSGRVTLNPTLAGSAVAPNTRSFFNFGTTPIKVGPKQWLHIWAYDFLVTEADLTGSLAVNQGGLVVSTLNQIFTLAFLDGLVLSDPGVKAANNQQIAVLTGPRSDIWIRSDDFVIVSTLPGFSLGFYLTVTNTDAVNPHTFSVAGLVQCEVMQEEEV